MTNSLSEAEVAAYERDGFHFPVRVMDAEKAKYFRTRLEAFEAELAADSGPSD